MHAFTLGAGEVVCIAGDWHTDEWWARKALSVAAENGARLVIHVGDFGYYRTEAAYLDALEAHCEELDLTLLFIDGNHEDFEALYKLPVDEDGLRPVREGIYHLPRGARFTVDGHEWLALGGASSVNRQRLKAGWDWFPEEDITEAEVAKALAGGPCQVLITHEGPHSPALDNHLGLHSGWPPEEVERGEKQRERVTRVMKQLQPPFLFHGHHHWRYTEEVGPTTVVGLDKNGSGFGENLHFVEADGFPDSPFGRVER